MQIIEVATDKIIICGEIKLSGFEISNKAILRYLKFYSSFRNPF